MSLFKRFQYYRGSSYVAIVSIAAVGILPQIVGETLDLIVDLQSWARAFLGFALALSRSWGTLFALALSRSFLALNFALLPSRFCAPALLDFSRSFFALLDFCARTFALLDFHAQNFVLVRQDSQDRTPRTGQAEQDSQNRTARTGQPEQDIKNGTGRTRQP
jgi:hypothetical protein